MKRGGQAAIIPANTLLIKDIGYLAPFASGQHDLIIDGAIYVTANEITWSGRTADLPPQFASADTILTLPHRIVIPGLVNSHAHTFQSLTRAVSQDVGLIPWLKTLFPAWAAIRAEELVTAAKLTLSLLILSGCTTTSDHCYVLPNDCTLDDTIRAAREVGIRFHPTRGAVSVGRGQGGLAPDSLVEDEAAVLEDMRRLITQYHDPGRFSMLRLGLAPATLLQASPQLFRSCAHLSQQHPHVRLHTHLAEVQEEVDAIREQHGCSPSEFLERLQWDQSNCWFAHGCKLGDGDRRHFARTGVGIAHCPSSNLRLCAGITPVRQLLDAGVNVGLGIDGNAGNDGGHMLTEARMAMLLQRANGDATGMGVKEAFRLAIAGGARNLGRDDIGQISPGFAADFVAWRTDSIALAGAMKDPLAGLLLCSAALGPVDMSVINGRIIVQDGQLLTTDLKALAEEHAKASERVCMALPEWWQSGVEFPCVE